MKKQLFLVALASASFASLANAQTTQELAERVTDFITMEQGHKAKWFDYTKGYHDAKIDLIKKHHKELTDLAQRKIAELGKTKDVDAYLSSKLADMIKLHEAHIAEWKALAQNWNEKAKSQGENEVDELAAFKEVEEVEEPAETAAIVEVEEE